MQESPDASSVTSKSERSLWRLQTALFTVYFALAAACLTMMVVSARVSLFSLTFTSTVSFVVAGVAAATSILLSLTSIRANRRVMTAFACWAGIAIAAALWSVSVPWQRVPLVVGPVWAGVVALAVVSLMRTVGLGGQPVRLSTAVPSIVGVVVLTLFLFLVLLGSGLAAVETHPGPSSPEGTWYSDYVDVDAGAFGGDTFVVVGRDLWGVIHQERTLYMGEWQERPEVEWLDCRTLLIGGVSYDIYTSPTRDRR